MASSNRNRVQRAFTNVSGNANRKDFFGRSGSRRLLGIILVVLIVAALTGYATNNRLNWLADEFRSNSNSVIQYGNNMIRSFNYLFRNFSGMTMIENYTAPDGTKSGFAISYSVLNMTVVNGTKAYEVNISSTATSQGEIDRESELVWVNASSGMVIQTYDNELGFTEGIKAQGENYTLDSFTTSPYLSMLNSSTVTKVPGTEQSVELGQVALDITVYHGLEDDTTFKNWTADVGVIPATGIQFVTFWSCISQSGYLYSFQILSITEGSYSKE